MPRWIDRLLGGPRRRRRRLERELLRLDREYAAWTSPRPVRRPGADVRGRLAFGIALVATVGMVVTVPQVVPAPVRRLVGLGPHRLGDAPPAASGTGAYAFMAHQPGRNRRPVAYDPCRPIVVRVNPRGGPGNAIDLVRAALDELSRATGLFLRYDGTTDERPHWDSEILPSFWRVRDHSVLVSWATSAEVRQLSGNVAGIGGSVPHEDADGVVRYVAGAATLDADAYAELVTRPDGVSEMRAIVLHELGHVVGLAHVGDPGELMNGQNLGLRDFGPGDRAGLARLGSGSCA